MENNSLNNLPPFYVGQKVVCVRGIPGHLIENQIYTVFEVLTCSCGTSIIDFGKSWPDLKHYPVTHTSCHKCDKRLATGKKNMHVCSTRFKPLQQQSFPLISLSKVIEEQLIPAN